MEQSVWGPPAPQEWRGQLSRALSVVESTAYNNAHQAITTHEVCVGQLLQAMQGTIPVTDIPTHTLLYLTPKKALDPVYGATLQYTRFCDYMPLNASNDGRTQTTMWAVNTPFLPPAITVGIAWGKPYCHIIPIPGITPDDWRSAYPPFHFNSTEGGVCLGKVFKIGDATDPLVELPKLIELLSWVNMTDPMYRLANAAIEYGGIWEQWLAAATAIEGGRAAEQDVFTRINQITLA